MTINLRLRRTAAAMVMAMLTASLFVCGSAAAGPISSVDDLYRIIRQEMGLVRGATTDDVLIRSTTALRPVAQAPQNSNVIGRIMKGACKANKILRYGTLAKANEYIDENYLGPARDEVRAQFKELAELQDYDDSVGSNTVAILCSLNF